MSRIKSVLIRRQLYIFIALVAVGVFLMISSQWQDDRLLSEGIAFIVVGLVGLLMSVTTSDIGTSIKEVVREVGEQTQEAVREMGEQTQEAVKEAVREMGEQNQEAVKEAVKEAVRESGKQNKEALDSLARSQEKIVELLAQVVKK